MNNIKIYTVLSIFCISIVENHGGLLDGVFGTVKNATQDVAGGVGNILSFGKSLVLGKHQSDGKEIVEEKKSIVGGFIDTVHRGIHNVHEQIRNVLVGEDKNNTRGIIDNVYDRMKNKLVKVTEFFGDGEKRKAMIDNSRDQVITGYNNLNKLIFGNGTKEHNSKFKEVINNLRNKIKVLVHHTTTEGPKPNNGEDINTDGTGLIDIRMASENLARNLDEDMDRTRQRFHQGIDELNNNAIRNRNYIEKIAKDAMDKEKQLMESGKQKIEDGAIVFRD